MTTTPVSPDGSGAGNGTVYGSRELPEETLAVCRQSVHGPEVDKVYIQSIAKSRGRNGEQDVRDYAGRQFGHQHGELQGQVSYLVDVLGAEIAGAERHCREYSAKQEKTPTEIEHHSEGKPWTIFSKVLVASLVVLSVAALAMGINTTGTVLMSSGIPAFEHPLRAYCYSMVPALLAAIIKCFGWLFKNESHRHNYTFAICGLGIFLGIVWAGSFAKTFPGFTQSPAEIVQSLTGNNGPSPGGANSGWMVFISILAEVCCAAGAFLVIQVVCDRHQKSVVVPNPAYESNQAHLEFWNNRRNENRRLKGQLEGKLHAIDDARKHFVESCVGYFHAALKLSDDADNFVKT